MPAVKPAISRFHDLQKIFSEGKSYMCGKRIHWIKSFADLYTNVKNDRFQCKECKKNGNKHSPVKYANGIVLYKPPAACEICETTSTTNMHRDHDHKTGNFRGWLCARCNLAMSMVDKVGLDKIAEYLKIDRAVGSK